MARARRKHYFLEIMPLLIALMEIFPPALAPYTLKEITDRLDSFLEPGISYGRVHRAFATLSDHTSTAALVKPLDDSERCLLFSAEAAQRIARKAVSRRLVAKLRANQNQTHS